MSTSRIDALRQALALSPDNHPLRQMLAEALQADGQTEAALLEYTALVEAGALDGASLVAVGELAAAMGRLDLAARCLDDAVKAGMVEGVAALRAGIDQKMEEQGYVRIAVLPDGGGSAVSHDLEKLPEITFADVGGLDDVKKVIHKVIILPYLRPDVYRRYGRRAGGGVLLYGPPGCGKTLLARATAGECKLPFVNVRIENILDPYIGISERNLHDAFEAARSYSPCVLFLDEIDAIGFARRKRSSSVGQTLVDQLLQELDAIGSDNRSLLVLAATNAPWDVDDALLRPGRFDRRIFVPPPDEPARREILAITTRGVHAASLNLGKIAGRTPLFSGADLKALVERAIDAVIDEALESATEPPLTTAHLEQALKTVRPTTSEWLGRAQNYIEFANEDRRYDEIDKFLQSGEAHKYRRQE